jgi:hypothetical protein
MKTTLFVLLAASVCAPAPSGGGQSLNPAVASYVKAAAGEFDRIPAERKKTLEKVALYVQSRIASGQEARLTFICTHNSRRSHLAQVWAQTAACYYGIPSVKTYSGGIAATACNARTVAALERAGFGTRKTGSDKNPVYQIAYSPWQEPMRAFSKVYGDTPNPTRDVCAVVTCDHADRSCN